MTITMTATETKAKILALLDQVAGGEEVLVTKHGRVIARIVPAGGGGQSLRGRFRDTAHSTVSDEELYSTGEPWEVME